MTNRPNAPRSYSPPPGDEPSLPPLSVWSTGQRDHATQLRDSGCVPGTETDTDHIPPAIAAHSIAAYSRPGELVLDPDCGTGTVLTEALRAGRHTVGLTTRARWWKIARANITATKAVGARHDGSVLDAHPRALATIRAVGLVGRVGLVLTTLRLATAGHLTSPDRDLAAAFRTLAATLTYCEPLLRSGGYLAVVARPQRHPDGSLVDLTTPVITAGAAAGLVPVERCIALTAELRGSRLVSRASFAERRAAGRARADGRPIAIVAHHEVLAFQRMHDAELAAAAAIGVLLPTAKDPRRAVNGTEYFGWRRAA
jgi:modification methylase